VRLYCATSNPGKLREFRLAAGAGWEFVPLGGVPPCEETGETFEDNAIEKAIYYSRHAPGLLFAEDSGLEVDALGGAPGVRSARFAGEGAGDDANNRLLIERLRGAPNRSARYVCVIALARDGKPLRTFRGEVDGRITDEPRGANGFGYDPYFFYPPFGTTFAEAAPERKLEVSHRGRALRQMFAWLAESRGDSQYPPAGRT
jgi:XTP/dITP diphosphohydrolase